MADQPTNSVKIDGNKLTGTIATMSFDLDFTGEGVDNNGKEGTPAFRLFAKSPRGRRIDVGGIWQRVNKEGNPYYTLTLNTGHTKWYANLGQYPGQDDPSLYAVIPNDYLNNPERLQ